MIKLEMMQTTIFTYAINNNPIEVALDWKGNYASESGQLVGGHYRLKYTE